MHLNAKIDYSAFVSPNIFDVLCESNLIGPLLLANLLSAELWELSEKIQSKAIPSESSNIDIDPITRSIQIQINKIFTHLQTSEVGDIYGYLNLDAERKRLGADRLDHQLKNVMSALLNRKTLNEEHFGRSNLIQDDVNNDQFPAYLYQNFDLVNAHKKYNRHGAKSPGRLTSCLDEVAIFMALVIATKPKNIQAIAVLSSWTHYSAFGYGDNNEAWWFYGKNCLISKSQWVSLVNEKFSGNTQACFDTYFSDFNKITTVSGSFSFESGQCSIEPEYITEYIAQIDAFFGVRLKQLDEGLSRIFYDKNQSQLASILRNTLLIKSRGDVQKLTEELPATLNSQIAYAYRSWEVDNRQPYLEAARRNPLTIAAARQLSGISDALLFVSNIEGSTSIFLDRDRVALPDETLRLRSGTDRDKALLLHVLLEHICLANPHKSPSRIRSIYGTKDSWVICDEQCLQLSDMQLVSEPNHSDTLFSFSL